MNSAVPSAKHIVIAGVAAVEALHALRRLAGDRVTLTMPPLSCRVADPSSHFPGIGV